MTISNGKELTSTADVLYPAASHDDHTYRKCTVAHTHVQKNGRTKTWYVRIAILDFKTPLVASGGNQQFSTQNRDFE